MVFVGLKWVVVPWSRFSFSDKSPWYGIVTLTRLPATLEGCGGLFSSSLGARALSIAQSLKTQVCSFCMRGWFEPNCKYWSVWVGFLNTDTASDLSCSTVLSQSKNYMNNYCNYWLLMCAKKLSSWFVLTITQIMSSTQRYHLDGVIPIYYARARCSNKHHESSFHIVGTRSSGNFRAVWLRTVNKLTPGYPHPKIRTEVLSATSENFTIKNVSFLVDKT